MVAGPAKLVFVRHGCTDANGEHGGVRLNGWTDAALNRKGLAQAERVAARLRHEGPFAAVYSSPLRRALDTANAIARAVRVRPLVRDGLREIHCGEFEGMDAREAQHRFPALWSANCEQRDQDFRWPGGESYREFRARCIRTIEAIARAHGGEHVIVVTHAGVVSQLIGHLTGASAARWEPFRPGNAALSEVEWYGRSGRLLRFDDRRHLSESIAANRASAQP